MDLGSLTPADLQRPCCTCCEARSQAHRRPRPHHALHCCTNTVLAISSKMRGKKKDRRPQQVTKHARPNDHLNWNPGVRTRLLRAHTQCVCVTHLCLHTVRPKCHSLSWKSCQSETRATAQTGANLTLVSTSLCGNTGPRRLLRPAPAPVLRRLS